MPLSADTFPRLLLHHEQVRGHRVALREKNLGIWRCWTWREVGREVRELAAGLHALGLERGRHVAVIGENRPRLYFSLLATQSLGAVPVPLYQDAVATEWVPVFAEAQIEFAIAEDQEQVDKLLEIRAQCPTLRHILYDDPRGLRRYHEPGLAPCESAAASGRVLLLQDPGLVERHIALGRGDDPAALFYTSGTTGRPKGVVQVHAALIERSLACTAMEGLTDREEVLAYLPLAWIGQAIFSFAQALVTGYAVNCPESPSTVMNDLREIGPTYFFAPPRVFEAMLTQVMIRMEDACLLKRRMFDHFIGVARGVGKLRLEGKRLAVVDRLQSAIGDLLVYGPVRNMLGLSRARIAYTAGEAIGPDLFVFFRSIGVNLKQLYGSTETSVFVCVQPDGEVRPDTVGPPVAGVQIRIADNGEVLVRSAGLLREYYRDPQATAQVKDSEGWFHTGDAGLLDARGHLKILDRAADVGRLADGSLFAPRFLENKLKFSPYIKEAVAFGQGRDRVCAFLNIDYEAVGNWAERRGLSYGGYLDLVGRTEVLDLVAECVARVNADLATDPQLAGTQIRRFVVLHKELDPDDGELTRTRKVRRRFIADKYRELVDALFDGRAEQAVSTEVRYEDGHSGTIFATLTLREASFFGEVPDAA
ncbi:MAG: AMP-binding protein [Burkholderiaceae bacterium]|nr:AMP-binding protein [Burkholderiaceae bacterium]